MLVFRLATSRIVAACNLMRAVFGATRPCARPPTFSQRVSNVATRVSTPVTLGVGTSLAPAVLGIVLAQSVVMVHARLAFGKSEEAVSKNARAREVGPIGHVWSQCLMAVATGAQVLVTVAGAGSSTRSLRRSVPSQLQYKAKP